MRAANVKKEFTFAVEGHKSTTFKVGEQELPDDAYAYAERKALLVSPENKERHAETEKKKKKE